jgi:hypothetical protein
VRPARAVTGLRKAPRAQDRLHEQGPCLEVGYKSQALFVALGLSLSTCEEWRVHLLARLSADSQHCESQDSQWSSGRARLHSARGACIPGR